MIIFQHVTKSFGNGLIALNDVSFEIPEGEFIFLTGHSGAGKTTVARLLTREYTPSAGMVKFYEDDLTRLSHRQVPLHRRRVGVVYQDYKLLSDLTIAENIALPMHIIGTPKAEIQQRIHDLLELVGLNDRDDVFPSQLSGGEAQRVSIARALATAPKVLFADEPTGNLDTSTTQLIMQILSKINQLGTTVLMATHDQSLIGRHPHRIFLLNNGELNIVDRRELTETSSMLKKKTTDRPSIDENLVEIEIPSSLLEDSSVEIKE